MDGFVLAPLAIVGYAGAVLVLGVVIRYSGGGKLPIQLEAVSSSSSTLPSPASSSSSSLKSTIIRGVKSATSTLKVAVRIPVQAVPRWASLTEIIAKRWQKRIMLEQLPVTASINDDPTPPAPATPQPVLVDLEEMSSVLSPLIPLRVLGTASPTILSPTPLQPPSISNVLATSRSPIFRLDSYSVPSTPAPHFGHRPGARVGRSSPFSPPSFGIPLQDPSGYVPRLMSPRLVSPRLRPQTPSPVYIKPISLTTAPALEPHRRTRSFGGTSPKRATAPLTGQTALPRNGGGTFVASSYGQGDVEIKPYRCQLPSSRGIELLIDLEGGVDSTPSLISLEDETIAYSGPSPNQASPTSNQPLLLHSPTVIQSSRSEPTGIEFPRVSNNSWRQWEKEDHDLLSMDPDYDVARFNTFEDDHQSKDPFGDLFLGPQPVKGPFVDSEPPILTPSPEGNGTFDPLFLVQAPSRSSSLSDPITPSQMPTPPASPPFSILRMPSTSSYSASPVDDYLVAKGVEIHATGVAVVEEEYLASDLEEDWEKVPSEGDMVVREPSRVGEQESVRELTDETPCDDPPLPEFPLIEGAATKPGSVSMANTTQGAVGSGIAGAVDPSFDDPPLPEIEPIAISVSAPPNFMLEWTGRVETPTISKSPVQQDRESESHPTSKSDSEVVEDADTRPAASTTLTEEIERPSWSLRAAEAPRLGLAAEHALVHGLGKRVEVAQDASGSIPLIQVTAAPESIARSDSIPGAFPSLPESEVAPSLTTATAPPNPEATRNTSAETAATGIPTPQLRRRTTSTIDTTSFAAAVVSLRRKPEPLDVALAMQMRPGVGAGADPAWMVRFMMAVFGWLAVTMSAGID